VQDLPEQVGEPAEFRVEVLDVPAGFLNGHRAGNMEQGS
jgi:hypothetical protein